MAIDKTAENLYALARDNGKRTKFARFLELMEPIETALGAGVSRETVRRELEKGELLLSLPTFKTFLQRARARRKVAVNAPRGGNAGAPVTAPAPSPEPSSTAPRALPEPIHQANRKAAAPNPSTERSDPPSTTVSHNPADLRGLRDADPGLEELSQITKGRKRK